MSRSLRSQIQNSERQIQKLSRDRLNSEFFILNYSALSLFVLLVRADHPHHAGAAHDLALVTDALD
jgi:hypothetical protein